MARKKKDDTEPPLGELLREEARLEAELSDEVMAELIDIMTADDEVDAANAKPEIVH